MSWQACGAPHGFRERMHWPKNSTSRCSSLAMISFIPTFVPSWTHSPTGELDPLHFATLLDRAHGRPHLVFLFLEDGRLVEQGTHEELMLEGGRYAELFDVQAASYR